MICQVESEYGIGMRDADQNLLADENEACVRRNEASAAKETNGGESSTTVLSKADTWGHGSWYPGDEWHNLSVQNAR